MSSVSSLHGLIADVPREDCIERFLVNADRLDPDPLLPGHPDPELQLLFVGLSGRNALQQGANFYRFVVDALERHGCPLTPHSRVFDFGVGWGRILRFFARDVEDANLYGGDVDGEVLDVARSCKVPGTLFLTAAYPPIPIAPDQFQLIYAFSVFSHLNGDIATQWMEEFHRLLRPDGIVVITTRARTFIEYCCSLRDGQGSAHENVLATLFEDTSDALAAYDRGEVVHEAISGGKDRPADFYGETAVPREFITREWSKWFDLLEWHDDPFAGAFQSVAVLKRRN